MNSAIVLMTILGCGDSTSACEYVRTAEARYASIAECQVQVDSELAKTGSANYPTVIAVCEDARAVAARSGPPAALDQGAAAPTVIMSEFDEPARQGPIRRTIEKTRDIVAGTGRGVGSAWRKLTGKERRDAEPLRLSRFVATKM